MQNEARMIWHTEKRQTKEYTLIEFRLLPIISSDFTLAWSTCKLHVCIQFVSRWTKGK